MIEYESYLKPAMEYVFDDTIVAPYVDKAMKIAYSNLKKRSVTLDGDVIMPGGDMSGSAVSRTESFLVTLTKLKFVIDERSDLERRLNEVQKSLANLEGVRKSYLSIEAEYKHHASKLDVIRNRLQLTSSHHKMFEAIKQLENDIKQLEEAIKNLVDIVDKSSTKMKDLRTKLSDKEQSHKKELESAEKALNSAKK